MYMSLNRRIDSGLLKPNITGISRTRRRILQAALWFVTWWSGLLYRANSNARNIQFRQEKIPWLPPQELQWMKILFLTDPHIGGNIDNIADEVGRKTHSLLEGHDPKKIIILHGWDFVSRRPHETSLTAVYKNSPLLYGRLAGYENHFWVRGNHDIDHSQSWEIIDHFSREHNINFLTSPYQKRSVKTGDAEIAVFGLDTGAAILHTMDPRTRDTLLDAYIEKLNTGKQSRNIVLMHSPDGFEFLLRRLKETQTKITIPTIMFAGHTHGGMINFPWLVEFALSRIHVLFWRYTWWYRPEEKYANTGDLLLYVGNGMGNSPEHDYRLWADPEVIEFFL